MQDPNSGSTASLHESEHPHLGRDSVLDIHDCPFRAHLQTSSPHMFLSVMLMEEPSSPGYYFRGSSHTSLLMICWQNEQGEPAAKNSILNHSLCRSQTSTPQQSCSILGSFGLTTS